MRGSTPLIAEQVPCQLIGFVMAFISPAIKYVKFRHAGLDPASRKYWIPAFAGMTFVLRIYSPKQYIQEY